MTRHRSELLGWTDIEDYDELHEALCFRYHPAVAAVLAADTLKAREASLKAADTYRRKYLKEAS